MREENEDSYGTLELSDGWFLTVCDGMGGYAGGRIASQTAVKTLLAFMEEHAEETDVAQLLQNAINAANDAVRTKAKADSRLGEMGTTCVSILVRNEEYWVAHVGDSRAYHFRDAVFTLRTEDHTVVQQLVNQGRIDPLEAANHPSAGILVRCLGQLDEVSADVTGPYPLESGDRLMLCSDGLSGMLYEDDIARVLTMPSEQDGVDALIRYANEAGGFDNITAVVLNAGDWPSNATSWTIEVDSPEGKALAAAEARQQAQPEPTREGGQTRQTLLLQAVGAGDDTRELEANAHLTWEPGKERWRKLGITTLILLAVAAVLVVLLTR